MIFLLIFLSLLIFALLLRFMHFSADSFNLKAQSADVVAFWMYACTGLMRVDKTQGWALNLHHWCPQFLEEPDIKNGLA